MSAHDALDVDTLARRTSMLRPASMVGMTVERSGITMCVVADEVMRRRTPQGAEPDTEIAVSTRPLPGIGVGRIES
jgi:hypothetical protein